MLLRLMIMMVMILTAVVVVMRMITTMLTAVMEVNMLICYSFVEIRIFDSDFRRQIRIVRVDLVETIDKRSILCLDTTTNR